MNIDSISDNSAVAIDLEPWLKPGEMLQQLARLQSPWQLWLDKYSFAWAVRCDVAADHWRQEARAAKSREDRSRERECKSKADALPSGKTAALLVAASLANNGIFAEICRRKLIWLEQFSKQHGDRFKTVDLIGASRLLLHLGRSNVLENVGLYADRTTGLPLIPGTALKGVLSTWACWTEHFVSADGSFRPFDRNSSERRNFSAAEAQLARQIFGDDSPTGSDHAGDVIFLGGFPATAPKLGLDIVNPHHESDGKVRTRLTPNAFLCIEPGTLWRFAFFVRPGAPDADSLLDQTSRWVIECLTQLGVGAKTAAGYGRFREPSQHDLAAHAKDLEKAKAAEAASAQQAKEGAARARQQAEALAALRSDYPNDATFKNRVLDKLNPGKLEQLRSEIDALQKIENQSRCEQLKKLLSSKDFKDIRKRLRDKDWFPKEWLPPQ